MEMPDDKRRAKVGDHEIRLILALLDLPSVGRATTRKILGPLDNKQPSSPKELIDALADARKTGLILPVFSLRQVEDAWRTSTQIIERSEELGIRIVSPSSVHWPRLLSALADPPLLLHVLGNSDCLCGDAMCALVGTLTPSELGRQSAADVGGRLARAGVAVVSGLALGCDTEGHQGCLDAGGKTVAVLAHGLDFIYPPQNNALAQRILDAGGALVSEYPVGVIPARWRFIERDRIQAGLSHGVILVESDLSDGSMHAVRHCLAMGRPLACLRHPEEGQDHRPSEANRTLVEEGKAYPLTVNDDLAEFVRLLKRVSP